MADESPVTMNDIRRCGHCASGVREFFAQYNLDLKDFVKNGISQTDFLNTGDANAIEVVRRKRALNE